MKKTIYIFIFFLLMLMGCKDSDWLSFSTYEGGFSIESPDNFTKKVIVVKSVIGPLKFKVYLLEMDRIVYLVGYSDYPDSVVQAKTPDELLGYAGEEAIRNLKGNVMRESKISLGKHPGREVIIEIPGVNNEHRLRLFLVGTRLYQLSVLTPKDQLEQSDPDSNNRDEALFNLGVLYEKLGDTDKSHQAFKQILSSYPNSMYFDIVKEKLSEKGLDSSS